MKQILFFQPQVTILLYLTGKYVFKTCITDKLEQEQIPVNKKQIDTSMTVKSTSLKESAKRTEKLPDYISNLIHERNKLRTENNKRSNRKLKAALNEHRQKISALISAHRCESWNNKVEKLKIEDN